MPHSFPKSARLARASEFQKVKREGTSLHGKFMILGVWRGAPDTKVGFVTSRKVGKAVDRNRVRRRLREIVRAMRPCLKGGLWIVLIARRNAVPASFAALREEWLRLAERAAILA